jgi:hypothetical protein
VTARLTPLMLKVIHNANNFESEIENRGLSVMRAKEFDSSKDIFNYTYYGETRAEYFASQNGLLDFFQNKVKSMKKNTGGSHGDIYIVTFTASPSGSPIESAQYFWAIPDSKFDAVADAIRATQIEPVDDQSIKTLVDQRGTDESEIQSLLYERESVAKAIKDNSSGAGGVSGTPQSGSVGDYLFQLNINKFGALTLITALIGVLSGIYKYNMRLSTFYTARADALRLHRSRALQGYADVVSALTPTINFGKDELIRFSPLGK